jgi:hypothetical protein
MRTERTHEVHVCETGWRLAAKLQRGWREHRRRTRVSLAVATDWHACGEDLDGARVSLLSESVEQRCDTVRTRNHG